MDIFGRKGKRSNFRLLIKLFSYSAEKPEGYKLKGDYRPSGYTSKMEWVHGFYPAPGIRRTTCAILGLLIPFLLIVGASYIFTTRGSYESMAASVKRLTRRSKTTR